MLKVSISDEDLRELIETGKNAQKYKKLAKDKKFVTKLAHHAIYLC